MKFDWELTVGSKTLPLDVISWRGPRRRVALWHWAVSGYTFSGSPELLGGLRFSTTHGKLSDGLEAGAVVVEAQGSPSWAEHSGGSEGNEFLRHGA